MLYQEDYSKRKRLREQSPFLSTRQNISLAYLEKLFFWENFKN